MRMELRHNAAPAIMSAATGMGTAAAPTFERVASLAELTAAKKQLVRLSNGRGVLLLALGGDAVTAMDHMCYHHGGPMYDGDIEDMHGKTCITCPWHKYKIEPASGACLYVGIDIATKAQAVRSKGPKQRVHLVKVEGDDVLVADSSTIDVPPEVAAVAAIGKGTIASDVYAFRPFNAGSKEAPALGVPIHSSSPAAR